MRNGGRAGRDYHELFCKGERVAVHLRGGGRGRHTTIPEHMPSAGTGAMPTGDRAHPRRRGGDRPEPRQIDDADPGESAAPRNRVTGHASASCAWRAITVPHDIGARSYGKALTGFNNEYKRHGTTTLFTAHEATTSRSQGRRSSLIDPTTVRNFAILVIGLPFFIPAPAKPWVGHGEGVFPGFRPRSTQAAGSRCRSSRPSGRWGGILVPEKAGD